MINLITADAVEWAQNYDGPLFHALLCDPPYHLTTIVKRFGKKGSAPAKPYKDGVFARASKGFMGQTWDGGDIAFQPETWAAFMRVLHPGAFGMAYASSRGWHRLACAIEDAGFIIHPTIFGWVNGQSFPKATRICYNRTHAKRNIQPISGTERNVEESLSQGTGSEVSCMRCGKIQTDGMDSQGAREQRGLLQPKLPSEGEHRTSSSLLLEQEGKEKAGIRDENGEKSGMEGRNNLQEEQGKLLGSEICEMPERISSDGAQRWIHNGAPTCDGETSESDVEQGGSSSSQESQYKRQQNKESDFICEQCRAQEIRGKEINQIWSGDRYGGQTLKNSLEPIIVFQKPYEGRPVDCMVNTGAGALNIEGGRIPTEDPYVINTWDDDAHPFGGGAGNEYTGRMESGRWPANFILGDEGAVRALDEQSGNLGKSAGGKAGHTGAYQGGFRAEYYGDEKPGFGDSGGASRFFYRVQEQLDEADPVYYCSKASGQERDAGLERHCPHPTLKPLDLNRYLATLLLPPEMYAPRRIFVPFAGVASECIGSFHALWEEIVGVEKENKYCEIGRARCKYYMSRGVQPKIF